MAGVDPELLEGARLLAAGRWRASHEVFEIAWRRSEGDGRELTFTGQYTPVGSPAVITFLRT